ncbi:hypothetical protein [Blastococcus sp. SYSU D00695]
MPTRPAVRAALLACAVLGVGLVPGVAAADPADTETVTECTETALRAAITDAPDGGTVEIACDDPILVTPEGGSTIVVRKTLTIAGTVPGVVVDGGNRTSLFVVEPGPDVQTAEDLPTLTLRDLTLTRGFSTDQGLTGGGAVWSLGNLVAERVAFTDNHSYTVGGAVLAMGHGTTTVVDSTFTGNTVTCPLVGSGGGAIAVRQKGRTTITGSTFTGNAVVGMASGGAVLAYVGWYAGMAAEPPPEPLPPHVLSGPVVISGSTFTGNAVWVSGITDRLLGGGAVATFDHPLDVSDSTFTGNHVVAPVVPAHGGAVLAASLRDTPTSLTTVDVLDGGFPDTAEAFGGVVPTDGRGGGIALHGTPATVEDTVVAGNRARLGGGLHSRGGPVDVTNSTIEGNTAGGADADPDVNSGGGISTWGPLTLTDSLVRDNAGASCVLWPAGLGTGDPVADGGGNEVDAPGSCFRPPVPATPPASTGGLGAPAAPTVPGDPVALGGSGFAPHARVTLAAYPLLGAATAPGTAAAAPAPVDLGTTPADAGGAFTASPVLSGAGVWRVVALGAGPSGTPVALSAVVVVAAAGTDVAPVVTAQPASASGAVGTSVVLTAAAAGAPAPTVRWQRSDDGGATWTDVPGATGGTLTVPVTAGGGSFRAVFTNAAGTATSGVALVSGPGGGSGGGSGGTAGGGADPVSGGAAVPAPGGPGSGGLALTGADVLPVAVAGGVLVLAGAVLVAGARRRRTAPAAD